MTDQLPEEVRPTLTDEQFKAICAKVFPATPFEEIKLDVPVVRELCAVAILADREAREKEMGFEGGTVGEGLAHTRGYLKGFKEAREKEACEVKIEWRIAGTGWDGYVNHHFLAHINQHNFVVEGGICHRSSWMSSLEDAKAEAYKQIADLAFCLTGKRIHIQEDGQ